MTDERLTDDRIQRMIRLARLRGLQYVPNHDDLVNVLEEVLVLRGEIARLKTEMEKK